MDRTALRARLVRREGRRLKPYRCTAGKLTIGVGRNLDDVGITLAESDALLDNDLDRVEAELLRALPWVAKLDNARQGVLMDMGFNLGVPGLLKFQRTLASIEAGNYALASEQMLESLWAKQVGKAPGQRAHELAKIMKEGTE